MGEDRLEHRKTTVGWVAAGRRGGSWCTVGARRPTDSVDSRRTPLPRAAAPRFCRQPQPHRLPKRRGTTGPWEEGVQLTRPWTRRTTGHPRNSRDQPIGADLPMSVVNGIHLTSDRGALSPRHPTYAAGRVGATEVACKGVDPGPSVGGELASLTLWPCCLGYAASAAVVDESSGTRRWPSRG
jgi:hypothetical protein